MKLQDLRPNPRNPRQITDEKLIMLQQSLEEFGDLSGFVENRTSGNLICGHQRMKVLPPGSDIVITQEYDTPTRTGTIAEGHVLIAGEKFKYRRVAWDSKKELAGMIAGNKHGGEWDFPILNDVMLELDQNNYDMDLTGFDSAEIEKQMTHVSAYDRELPRVNLPKPAPTIVAEIRSNLKVELIHSDCLEALKRLPENSADSLVTDPPAGISFMGTDWDSDKGGSKEWIGWMAQVMKEALRVLKPGAHGLVWAIPRTSHWMGCALEDSGFEVRDIVTHIFGSGFPKSLDISKAIDKSNGDTEKRPVLGTKSAGMGSGKSFGMLQSEADNSSKKTILDVTSAASAASAAWEGWGTSLKPAMEVWWLVRKPLSEKTVAANVLKWGTGGINIDGCRIGTYATSFEDGRANKSNEVYGKYSPADYDGTKGRFPANVVLSHNEDCKLISPGGSRGGSASAGFQNEYVGGKVTKGVQPIKYENEEPEQWACTEGCAVALLDGQSGQSGQSGQFAGIVGAKQTGKFEFHAGIGGRSGMGLEGGTKDFGGASRFFLCVKPSRSDMAHAACGPKKTEGAGMFAGKKTANKYEDSNTDGFGSSITDQFQMNTISTTKTETHSIISFQIWNAFTKMSIGTVTIEAEKTTESYSEENVAGVSVVSNTEFYIHLRGGNRELIKGIVSFVPNSIYENGKLKIETDGMNTIETIGAILETLTTKHMLPEIEKESENGRRKDTSFPNHSPRFFYCSKISARERNLGLEGEPDQVRAMHVEKNTHPTVKAIKLMRYFCRLVTPPNGLVLDPFMGSGTTGVAAKIENFDFIGIEQDENWVRIAKARIENSIQEAESEPVEESEGGRLRC